MCKTAELPFSMAETNEALQEEIKEFDKEKYEEAVKRFLKEHGVLEDGKASKRVVNVVEKYLTTY